MSGWESNIPDFSGGFESYMLFSSVYGFDICQAWCPFSSPANLPVCEIELYAWQWAALRLQYANQREVFSVQIEFGHFVRSIYAQL